MTAKAELCRFLLEGRVLSLVNCFKDIGLSNPGREIPRMIEKPFLVHVSRVTKVGKNRFGSPVSYTEYRLNRITSNLPGIELMKAYVLEQAGGHSPRTAQEVKNKKILDQIQLF